MRGASSWKRGVRADAQVLVCPDCQREHNWLNDLDTCSSCGSTMLVRLMGETRCRACGAAADPDSAVSPSSPAGQPDSGLAADVEAALRRRFSGGG